MPHSTRDRLVSTAMRLFCENGYGCTSLPDLLTAAGVNSEGLYGLFAGKRELLIAVLDAHRSGIREMLLEPAWRDVSDPIEKIFSLLAHYRQLLVKTDGLYECPIGSLALEIREPDRRFASFWRHSSRPGPTPCSNACLRPGVGCQTRSTGSASPNSS